MSTESDKLYTAVTQNDVETATNLLADTWQRGGTCAVRDLAKEATTNKEEYSSVSFNIELDPKRNEETITVSHEYNASAGHTQPIAGITGNRCIR
ncbi:MAG: hypothetical protein IPI39_19450 [Candidatus Obscuribacter sp.]|nr:hypothetical protein [Candidatus Obscuribacter sp.]MBK9620899.1 hypothetical protein [Candidatus Obscuribacter sp.]